MDNLGLIKSQLDVLDLLEDEKSKRIYEAKCLSYRKRSNEHDFFEHLVNNNVTMLFKDHGQLRIRGIGLRILIAE